jgi:hypothetical protein
MPLTQQMLTALTSKDMCAQQHSGAVAKILWLSLANVASDVRLVWISHLRPLRHSIYDPARSSRLTFSSEEMRGFREITSFLY